MHVCLKMRGKMSAWESACVCLRENVSVWEKCAWICESVWHKVCICESVYERKMFN